LGKISLQGVKGDGVVKEMKRGATALPACRGGQKTGGRAKDSSTYLGGTVGKIQHRKVQISAVQKKRVGLNLSRLTWACQI